MKDNVIRESIKVAARNVIAFIVVILIIFICGILFGAEQYSLVSSQYDRPTMNFHDHRIY